MITQHDFHYAITSGNYYADKLSEALAVIDRLLMSRKSMDIPLTKERNSLFHDSWAKYHLKRLLSDFDITRSYELDEFLKDV